MQREIKVRGLRPFNEWAYGNLVVSEDGTCYIVTGQDDTWTWHEVKPGSVGQYTGLKDKKGKEIYEGDILDGHSDGYTKVVWVPGGWELIFSDEGNIGIDELCTWFGNQAIVAGNIHDNSELMKGK